VKKMKKTVIDTNVLISAMLGKSGPPWDILDLLEKEQLKVLVTEEIFKEYVRVTRYNKFKFTDELRNKTLGYIARFIVQNPKIQRSISGVPDDDLKFVHAALEYDADCLITGNTKHFAPVLNVIKVVTPAEFIKRYEIKS